MEKRECCEISHWLKRVTSFLTLEKINFGKSGVFLSFTIQNWLIHNYGSESVISVVLLCFLSFPFLYLSKGPRSDFICILQLSCVLVSVAFEKDNKEMF